MADITHSGNGDIITGGRVTKTTIYGSGPAMDYAEVARELHALMEGGGVDGKDAPHVGKALAAAKEKDEGGVKRALKALSKRALDFAQSLALAYLTEIIKTL